MAQLKMYRLPGAAIEKHDLPEGFSFSNFKSADDIAIWAELCRNGLIGDTDDGGKAFSNAIASMKDIVPEEDLFFLDHNGVHVGTVTAFVYSESNIGDVHMVSIGKDYRGKGLAKFLNMKALEHLERKNPRFVQLTTDDWRKGAIKSYLNAGFLPVDYDVDMVKRWSDVLREIGIDGIDMLDNQAKTKTRISASPASPNAPYENSDIFTNGEFFVGCNYWCKNAGMYMWSKWDPQMLEEEIGQLAACGVSVMRVFPLWQDFQPLTGDCHPGGQYRSFRFRDNQPLPNWAGVDDEMVARFRFMCDICARNGIRLIVGLITGWMSGRQFVPCVFEEKDVLADPVALMWETRFVKYLVEKLKDHPAIAAWDFGNECNCMATPQTGQAGFYNWMDHIGMAIHLADPSRPVVSGMHGLKTDESACVNIRLNGELSDVLCTHPYALYVPGCGKEPFNTMRVALHPTAESLLYRDIGGKPCFIEEIGNIGAEYTSEERTASGIRTTLFSAWANDLKGLLWWCNSDQEDLAFPPYDLTACERELGLLRQDYSPKPVMREMKRFEDFRKSLPFAKLPARKTNCCIVVPEKVDGWQQSFGLYILARQAGLDPVFAGAENHELPDASLYLIASVNDDFGYSYTAQRKWQEKAKGGATVLVVLGGNSRFTHFRNWTGLKVDYGCRSAISRTFEFDGCEMTVQDSFTTRLLPDGATIFAETEDGEPMVSVFGFGAGKVMVMNGPIDQNAINRTDCFTGENLCPYWKVLAKAKEIAGIKNRVEKSGCPMVCFTEHPASQGSSIVMAINFEPRPMDCPIAIDGKLGRIWKGDVTSSYVRLDTNEAALFEVV